jgi:hypothetical protein
MPTLRETLHACAVALALALLPAFGALAQSDSAPVDPVLPTGTTTAISLANRFAAEYRLDSFGASVSLETTTGTILAGSRSLALGAQIHFKPKQWVRIPGAGTAYAGTSPGSLVTTPSCVAAAGTTCTTSYTYAAACYDTLEGGGAAATASAITTGPNILSPNNRNTVSWTADPSAAVCWIWRQIGAAAWACVGSSTTTSWADIGQPFPECPSWVPATPPAAAQRQRLVAQILSLGRVNGVLTAGLDRAAVNGVSNATVTHDDTAAWNLWVAKLNATGANGVIRNPNPDNPTPGVVVSSPLTALSAPGTHLYSRWNIPVMPTGAGFGNLLFYNGGGPQSSPALTLSGHFVDGTTCIPISDVSALTRGQYLYLQKLAPGGASQSSPYSYIGRITALTPPQSCAATVSTGVTVDTPTLATFPAATTVETIAASVINTADTLTLTVSGGANFTATYNPTSNGMATNFVAKGLMVAFNQAAGSTGLQATWTGNTIEITVPNGVSVTITPSVTHGGGGDETLTQSAGTPATVQVWQGLDNVGAEGLNIDMRNASGSAVGRIVGLLAYHTSNSDFSRNRFSNVHNGIAEYIFGGSHVSALGFKGYRASSSPNNLTSFSDFWAQFVTDLYIADIDSDSSLSFGPSITNSQWVHGHDIRSHNGAFGRSLKVGAVAGLDLVNVSGTKAEATGFAISDGTRHARLTNVSTVGNIGVSGNATGIWISDQNNSDIDIVNFESFGNSKDDIECGTSDSNIRLSNGRIGDGVNFTSAFTPCNPSLVNVNGAALAGGSAGPNSSPTVTLAQQSAGGIGSLAIGGALSAATLAISGDVQLASTLEVAGVATFTGNLTAGNGQTCGAQLSGAAQNGNLAATGANCNLHLSGSGSANNVALGNSNGFSFFVVTPASTINSIVATGSASGSPVRLSPQSSGGSPDANVSLQLSGAGNGGVPILWASGSGLPATSAIPASAGMMYHDGTQGASFWCTNSGGSTIGCNRVDGGLSLNRRTITTGTGNSATSLDFAIYWNSPSSGAKTQSIPGCSSVNDRAVYVIADEAGTAGTDNITITPLAGTIKGGASLALNANFQAVRLQCDASATNWMPI